MSYLSAIIYTFMIPNFNELVNGSSLSLPAHGRAGARATPFLFARPSEAGNGNFTNWLPGQGSNLKLRIQSPP